MTNRIAEIIEEAQTMKNAYFFSSPGNAASRRWYEEQHSHALVEWEEGGHKYSAKFEVSCSCQNVYAHGEYTKDDNKTTLTAIQNSYKRLMAQAQ